MAVQERSETPEALLSLRDTGELLDLGESTVRRLIRQGDLQVVRIGSRVLIEREEIRRFVEARRG
jgi:excisionase family DNA binding protein